MFQFRRFPSYTYEFSIWCIRFTYADCSIRIPSDIMCACHSPRLFAAYRVLLRLLMPRHPPCALISLNAILQNYVLFSKNLSILLGEVLKLYLPIFFEVLLHKKLGYFNFLFVVSLFNFQWTIFIPLTFEVFGICLVEIKRIELLTPCLQSRCSPSWAKPP